LRELRPSLRRACERRGFRVVHYWLQRNQLHVLVESPGKEALGRGIKALSARKPWRERHGTSPPERLGAACSGRWFDGWRRHGLVDPEEVAGR
jgi:REP element-mobilizing transposase RayT